MILMFLVVFRSSQKRKRWFTHGEKKSRTTNLDFPSVLLNQGLEPTTKRRKLLPHKEEEKRGKETVIAIKSSTGDAARQHVPPQNNGEKNAHYTTRETTRVYNKHDHKRRDRHHTGREQTQISLLNEPRKERRRKSISKSREKEVLRARAIWIWTFQ